MPVMNPDCGAARNSAVWAISSTVPKRAIAPCETERDRLADALPGTGHQRNLTCQDGPGHLRIMSLKFGSHIRGRPGFDVVGSPAELQAEVAGWPRKSTGTNASAKQNLALAA